MGQAPFAGKTIIDGYFHFAGISYAISMPIPFEAEIQGEAVLLAEFVFKF